MQVQYTMLYCFYFMCVVGDHLGQNIMKNEFRRELDEEQIKNVLSVEFTCGCCFIDNKQ